MVSRTARKPPPTSRRARLDKGDGHWRRREIPPVGDPETARSWYVERFRSMAVAGDDLGGETRFLDAMLARHSRVLDAGCGPGRAGSVAISQTRATRSLVSTSIRC